MNPLLQKMQSFDGAIEFSKINESDFLPALEEAIKLAKANLEEVKKETSPNFTNIIEKIEFGAETLDQVVNVYYTLYSAHCTDALSDISEEFSTKLTNYSSDFNLDEELFKKVKAVYDLKEDLTAEQSKLLEATYSTFTRNGALLGGEDKEKLRSIDQELSNYGLKFSENVRKATNDYILFIDDESKLDGLPESSLEPAKALAVEKGKENAWAFTLQYPSYAPFMKYCNNRELRKELYTAFTTRATSGELDNRENVVAMLRLREERAKLLGYENHATYTLEKRMAKKPETVMEFLEDLYTKSFSKAQDEVTELAKYQDESVEAYDTSYLSEKYKKDKLNFDDEVLRPYFKLENVINGAFTVAEKLYGLKFTKRDDVEGYHKDVTVYEVNDANGYLGLFYTDFFPRAEKRPGAWMGAIREQSKGTSEIRPHINIVCNFTPSTATKPSLLTLNSVLTLFHEFGHALHGLLANSQYKSLSGTNVYWDFVELPSQVMENWVSEKECLELFAHHYESGELIPDHLIEKIKESGQFLEAMGTIRQLSFATLDMECHLAGSKVTDILAEESRIMEKFSLTPKLDGTNMSCSFGHLYGGGYSAGYYSYKWAEVLDADAFSLFKEKGIFNTEVAKSFRENILERGGTEDPMELFKKFRGREPQVDALLERSGLS